MPKTPTMDLHFAGGPTEDIRFVCIPKEQYDRERIELRDLRIRKEQLVRALVDLPYGAYWDAEREGPEAAWKAFRVACERHIRRALDPPEMPARIEEELHAH